MTTEPGRRFQAAFTWAILAWAAANALSFFFWSGGWGNLLGTRPDASEAVGFPWIVWRQGDAYGGYFCDVPALAGGALAGALVAVLAGLAAARFAPGGSPVPEEPEGPMGPTVSPRHLQFSLRALLAVTALLAVGFAVARTAVVARPVLLGMVYFLGPAVIVLVTFGLRRVVRVQRNLVVLAATLLLIVASAALGESIGAIGDFTKGIFGTFIFWTPQCTLIALAVVLRRWWSSRLEQRGFAGEPLAMWGRSGNNGGTRTSPPDVGTKDVRRDR